MSTGAKAEAFEVCAQRVLNGASVEQALEGYPEWTEEFTPLLETLRSARLVGERLQVPEAAQAHSRAVYLAKARRLAQPKPTRTLWSGLRLSVAVLMVLMVMLVTGATVVSATAQSLPGDQFYPLKLMTEKTRLRLTRDPARRIQLEKAFDRQRLMEVDALIRQSRPAQVSFVGELMQTSSGEWYVGDVRILTSSETEMGSGVAPGIYVGVDGALKPDGSVTATRVQAREYRLEGALEQRSGETWVVGGVSVRVPEWVAPSGFIPLGSRVGLQVMEISDGSLVARLVELVALPQVLPAPSATASAASPLLPAETEMEGEPEITEKPGGQDRTPEVDETEDGEETEEPGETRQPSKTPKPQRDEDETPEASKTPEPGDDGDDTPEPSETPGEDDDGDETPEPTRTRKPSETPEPEETAKPTETPEPEDTPLPSQTDEPTDD